MNGGPAFPRPASEAHRHGMHEPQVGMTLRDYFAAVALGCLAVGDEDRAAKWCYQMADAMLKARES
jgi:hypothetical protein